jgi:hypothetical protein
MRCSLQHEKSEEKWDKDNDGKNFLLPFLRLHQIVDQQDADKSDENVVDNAYDKFHEYSNLKCKSETLIPKSETSAKS